MGDERVPVLRVPGGRPASGRSPQAEARSLSTRASITATSFVNEYHWGDFRGDPSRMMERYYDAHLYLTNWGTHRIMLRLRATCSTSMSPRTTVSAIK